MPGGSELLLQSIVTSMNGRASSNVLFWKENGERLRMCGPFPLCVMMNNILATQCKDIKRQTRFPSSLLIFRHFVTQVLRTMVTCAINSPPQPTWTYVANTELHDVEGALLAAKNPHPCTGSSCKLPCFPSFLFSRSLPALCPRKECVP